MSDNTIITLWEPCPHCVEIGNMAAKDDPGRYRHARLCSDGCKHGGDLHPGGREVRAKRVPGEALLVDEYYWVLVTTAPPDPSPDITPIMYP